MESFSLTTATMLDFQTMICGCKKGIKRRTFTSSESSYVSVLASGQEVISVFTELHSCHGRFVAFQGVNVAALKQVKHLCVTIIAAAEHEMTRRMKVQRVDAGVKDSVILNEFAHLQVVELHARILLSDRDDVVVVMPAQLVAEAFLVFECVDELASLSVEDSQGLVFGARSDHSVVG